MYLEYWGLKKFPFENVSDPEFIYYSKEHEEALTRLLYAAMRKKGAALLTGELGCGKTTMSRAFIQRLSSTTFDVGLITNPSLSPMDFLRETLNQFSLDSTGSSKVSLLNVLNAKLLANAEKGIITIMIIDEAQAILRETIEEIRLLLNFQLDESFLITFILIGQPEFKDMIREFKQFDQRIAIRYHLNALSREETGKYIAFRLNKAGQSNKIFPEEVIDQIYAYSGGVPRKINNVCDIALLAGAGSKSAVVVSEIIKKVVTNSL